MSNENPEVFELDIDGELGNFSLADFANIDLSQVEARRGGSRAPEGVAEWRIKEAGFTTGMFNDKNNPGQKKATAYFFVKLESIAYRTTKDTSLVPAELVGVQHEERIIIKKLRDDLGRVVAFMEDVGLQNVSGSPLELASHLVDMEFVAPMKHQKDRNDPDKVYANLDVYNIEPMTGGAVPGAPAAAPGLGGLKLSG